MYRRVTAHSSFCFGQHGSNQADDGVAVGEDADDVGAPVQFGG
jgi:hypothetical protein